MEDLLARSQVPRSALSGVLAWRSHVIEKAPREARREEEGQMTDEHDEDKRPWKKRFVPAERWVLPAKRPSSRDAEQSDAKDDTAKQRALANERIVLPVERPTLAGRGRIVLQTGLGLCVSFVLAACGARDNRPQHVGPPLGDTHVSQAPSDPTVPPPDAADYETPSPGYEITPPQGPAPNVPAPSSQEPAPQPAPEPGVFSPPPPPTGPADVPQPEIPKP
jgi:hypothetical protein